MLLKWPYSLVTEPPKTRPAAQASDRRPRIAPPVEEKCAAAEGSTDKPASLHLLNPNGAEIGMGGRRNARASQCEQSYESGTKSRGGVALHKHLDLLRRNARLCRLLSGGKPANDRYFVDGFRLPHKRHERRSNGRPVSMNLSSRCFRLLRLVTSSMFDRIQLA